MLVMVLESLHRVRVGVEKEVNLFLPLPQLEGKAGWVKFDSTGIFNARVQ
jgi:hypothetical protein